MNETLTDGALSVPVGASTWEVSAPLLVWGVAYVLALATSGVFVRWVLKRARFRPASADDGHATPLNVDAGVYIGKLENVLVVTFVALNEFTALALVFAAKGIVRAKEGNYASYYLLGTLANFTWALTVALLARRVLALV